MSAKKHYVFLIMGDHYDPAVHRCQFDTPKETVSLRTARDFDEAKRMAVELRDAGVGAIEVCGAFGPDKARQLAEATGGTVAIGYVTHHPEMDSLFGKFFG